MDAVGVVVVDGEVRERTGVVRQDLVPALDADPADDLDHRVVVPDAAEVVPVLVVDAVEVAPDERRVAALASLYSSFSFERISFIALNENPASDGSPKAVMFQRIGWRRPCSWNSANCSTTWSTVPQNA